MKVSIAQARAQLSKILSYVAKGQTIIITERNEPKFQITSLAKTIALPPESEYEKFLKEFKPITQEKKATSVCEMIRQDRDQE